MASGRRGARGLWEGHRSPEDRLPHEIEISVPMNDAGERVRVPVPAANDAPSSRRGDLGPGDPTGELGLPANDRSEGPVTAVHAAGGIGRGDDGRWRPRFVARSSMRRLEPSLAPDPESETSGGSASVPARRSCGDPLHDSRSRSDRPWPRRSPECGHLRGCSRCSRSMRTSSFKSPRDGDSHRPRAFGEAAEERSRRASARKASFAGSRPATWRMPHGRSEAARNPQGLPRFSCPARRAPAGIAAGKVRKPHGLLPAWTVTPRR